MPRPKKWSAAEDQLIRDYYKKMPTSELAMQLNCTESSVRARAYQLGLSRKCRKTVCYVQAHTTIPEEAKDTIIRLFIDLGEPVRLPDSTISRIMTVTGLTRNSVHSILTEYRQKQFRKYHAYFGGYRSHVTI